MSSMIAWASSGIRPSIPCRNSGSSSLTESNEVSNVPGMMRRFWSNSELSSSMS